MYKKLLLSIAMLSLFLAGCTGGSYTIRVGGLSSSANSLSGEYDRFSGYYFKKVKFTKGETVHFHFSSTADGGTLSAQLMDSSGDKICEITDDTTIDITKTDTYKVQVNSENHKGSFTLSWSSKNKE